MFKNRHNDTTRIDTMTTLIQRGLNTLCPLGHRPLENHRYRNVKIKSRSSMNMLYAFLFCCCCFVVVYFLLNFVCIWNSSVIEDLLAQKA